MSKYIRVLAVIGLAITIAFAVSACGSQEGSSNGTDETAAGSTASASQDAEGSKEDESTQETTVQGDVVIVDTPAKNFCGTWTADSDKAEYMYGTLKIKVKDDNTWKGNITGEKLHGTWEEKDFGIHLDDEVLDWECDLFYTDKGNFVLDEDGMKVVLTKH